MVLSILNLLDDSAFFAANSLEKEFFVLTSSYTTYLLKPVIDGELTAVGKVVSTSRSQWIVESVVCYHGSEVARGLEFSSGVNILFRRQKVTVVSNELVRDEIQWLNPNGWYLVDLYWLNEGDHLIHTNYHLAIPFRLQ